MKTLIIYIEVNRGMELSEVNSKLFIRSLQRTGKSTYIISLPKQWIIQNGLERGSKIVIEILDDNSLKLYPYKELSEKEEEYSTVKIKIKKEEDITGIERILIACYQAGYDIIIVTQEPYISDNLRDKVRKALLRLSGLEVVEETADSLVLQSIIDASQISLMKTLERMENIVFSMISDTIKAVELGDSKIIESIIERDNELDKFYFFLGRQITMALGDPKTANKMGLKAQLLVLPYKTYGKCLEEMGDSIVSIGRYLLSENAIPASLREVIKEVLQLLMKSFNYAVKAFRGDKEAGKNLGHFYTSFFLSYPPEFYRTNVVVLSASRFLSLAINIVEAQVEKEALEWRLGLHASRETVETGGK